MFAEFHIKYITTKSVKGRAVLEYLFNLAIEFKEECVDGERISQCSDGNHRGCIENLFLLSSKSKGL